MSISSAFPSLSKPTDSSSRAMPVIVELFFLADLLVVLAAIASHLIAQHFGHEAPGFFRLSYESNLPTWYSSAQHAVVGTLIALLAIREIRVRPKRWCVALPALMFLFFSFDEVAMVHERIGHFVETHSRLGAQTGMTNSAPAMIFCLPAALAFAVYAAWSTRPYWQGRRSMAFKFVLGTGLFLFVAGGLEIFVNVVKAYRLAVSFETLVEELGEMISTTIVLWSVIELLALEKFAVNFDAKGIHFGRAVQR